MATEPIDVQRIWSRAAHCAFTDLVRFRGRWFCVFRESDSHARGRDGGIRVISSSDGRAWKSEARLNKRRVDLRDPHLSITPWGELMLTMGGSVWNQGRYLRMQPQVAFSRTGRAWSSPEAILHEGEWLWRVAWHRGHAYGIAKLDLRKRQPECASQARAILYRSRDGRNYTQVCRITLEGVDETALGFDEQGRMIAVARRGSPDCRAAIGISRAPFTRWRWSLLPHYVGGPAVLLSPGKPMILGGRHFPACRPGGQPAGEPVTFLGTFDEKSCAIRWILPSAGDNSYPGLCLWKDTLWASYYSSHEGKSAIYLARIPLARFLQAAPFSSRWECWRPS